MRLRYRFALPAVWLALVAIACVGEDVVPGAGPVDAGLIDAGPVDSAPVDSTPPAQDGAVPIDAGGSDTGACPATGCEKEIIAVADTTSGTNSDRKWAEITYGVAVDDDYVYYTTWPVISESGYHPWPSMWGGRVFYRNKKQIGLLPAVLEETAQGDIDDHIARSDGGLPTTDATYHTASMPSFLVRVGDRIVWDTWYVHGGIRSRSVSAGGVGPRVEELACDTCGFFRMATDGTTVFAVQYDRAILALTPNGGAVPRTLVENRIDAGVGTDPQIRGVAVSDGRVYYSTRNAIKSVPVAGGEVTTHYELTPDNPLYGPSLLDSIAVVGNYVYYADRQVNGGMVARIDLTSPAAAPVPVGTNLGSTQTLLVDGTTLYLVGYSAGVIYAIDLSLPKFPRVELVKNLRHPHDIAVDETYLYIAGGDDATIYRVRKR